MIKEVIFQNHLIKKKFNEIISSDITFIQDNHSHSKKNVLRGLHFQSKHPQGKLVRVVNGSVFDVVVDIRKNSKTFGKWYGIEISGDNLRMLWVPPGLAHGFCVLSDEVDFLYKCTEKYYPQFEETLNWNDKDLNIKWPVKNPIISCKDNKGIDFKDL